MKNKQVEEILKRPLNDNEVILERIETSAYTFAVSNEEIKGGDCFLHPDNTIERASRDLDGKSRKKIIAYRPEEGAPELDLPLLPELVVEDDVEKLADDRYGYYTDDITFVRKVAYTNGYKNATKVYSEKLHKLLSNFYVFATNGEVCNHEVINEFIQSLKQPKPKWFVAEKVYYYHSSKELYSDATFIKCDKEQYESIKKEIPTCPLKTELKTTTIDGKEYLAGTYL